MVDWRGEQRLWDRFGDAALEALAATGATLDTLHGWAPLQAEGRVDDCHFYFRARSTYWQFNVAREYLEIDSPAELFAIERDWDGDADGLGCMPRHKAVETMIGAIAEFRAARVDSAGSFA